MLAALLALAPACLPASQTQSEQDEILVVRDAALVLAPGVTLPKGTLVVRRGLIEAVGENVEIPPGARVIDGTGLTGYAGFIDAHSAAGIPDTKRSDPQVAAAGGETPDYGRDALPAMEEANRKGIRARLLASEILQLSEADAKKWAQAGFTAANAVAGDEYFAGQGTLVAMSGRPIRSAVVLPSTGLHAGFSSYGDGYPRTVMGVLAHVRQALLDARHYRELHEHYERNPLSTSRPPHDPDLEALLEALDGKIRVLFEARTDTEILRAIALGREFGLAIALTGASEACKVVDAVKDSGAFVILSLDWPKEPRKIPKADRDKFVPKPAKLIEEEKRLYEERILCAIALHKAGIPFALSVRGTDPAEALKRIETLASKGLPIDAAVAALTVRAAEFFGVEDRLGRLAKGRMAHATFLTKPLGAKGAGVRYAIVDGRLWEFEPKKKPSGEPAADLAGTWKASARGGQGEFEFTLEIVQDGSDLSGSIRSRFGNTELKGTIGGTEFEMTGSLEVGEIVLTGEMKEGGLEGTLTGPRGLEATFTASKEPGR